jgi:hypothetical protein
MSDVLWSDVSEFQCAVDDTYPYQVLAIRANDGTYKDQKFVENYAWARQALESGKLRLLIIYMVYRPNWQDGLTTIQSLIVPPHDKAVIMIDVESWGGQITGDHSASINGLAAGLTEWIGDPARVIGYGNTSDLNTLWPNKPDNMKLIIAGYGVNPAYPNKIGHQFTDGTSGGPIYVPPFGNDDVNSADGYDIEAFCAVFSVVSKPSQEDDNMQQWFISGQGRKVIICPTGSASADKRLAWLSAATVAMTGAGQIDVYAQSDTSGINAWTWDDKVLTPNKDNLTARVFQEIKDGTTHLVITWDLTSCPEGATLCLETRATV